MQDVVLVPVVLLEPLHPVLNDVKVGHEDLVLVDLGQGPDDLLEEKDQGELAHQEEHGLELRLVELKIERDRERM